MLIAKIQDGTVVEVADYRALFPNTSFSSNGPDAEFLAANGCMTVTVFKPYDSATQKLVSASPYIEDNQVFTVAVEDKTAEELAAEEQTKKDRLLKDVVDSTQRRLDDFAKTRNYDGILSLATYATSTNVKFQTEGQYGVTARDATWAKLYEMLAEVEAGTRPMPTGFQDIEPELPILEWPIQPEEQVSV